MKRFAVLAALLTLFCAHLFGFTFYVQTVNGKEYGDMESDEKEKILCLENGVMDYLFDNGQIFFSLQPADNAASPLETGIRAGADYVIIINTDISNEIVNFELLDTISRKKIGSGNLSRDIINGSDDMKKQDLFYKLGAEISRQVFGILY